MKREFHSQKLWMPFLTLTLGLALCTVTLTHPFRTIVTERKSHFDEPLYLPNGAALELIAFGFKNVLARVLWFNTINYFGKQYGGEKNYKWLYHMCDLVTTLDPRATHVFQFGAVMLSWEAQQPNLSIKLLNKLISYQPNNWHFYYLRGFTFMFFLKDSEAARKDFISGARLPDAPPMMARLASRVSSDKTNDMEAVVLLEELMRTTQDPNARKALNARLKELKEKR